MRHKKIKEKLTAFQDGELPEAESREIKSHIETCSECQETLKNWGRIRTVLSRTRLPKASESFVSRVMESLTPEEEIVPEIVRVRPRPFLRWAIPVAGYAFALLLVVLVLMPQEPAASTENVLLADAPEGVQLFVSQEPLDISQLFNGKGGINS